MMTKILAAQFDGQEIRRVYDDATEVWWFSVIDVVQVLTQQPDDLAARKYWNQLKRRLAKEGSQLVTNCHQLKLPEQLKLHEVMQLREQIQQRNR